MLQAATFSFLSQLAANNHKEWFDAHRKAYQDARADAIQLVTGLQKELSGELPELAAQPAKDAFFRIFRDVRFSKNKTPYKTHFGAYLSRGGRKWEGAGYYLHLEPGKSFLGAGMWQPQPALLKAVRQELDYNWEEWQGLINHPAFKKHFKSWEGEVQKTIPKGYDAGNPALDFLKRKSFIATLPLSDDILSNAGIEKKLAAALKAAASMVAFLNRALD